MLGNLIMGFLVILIGTSLAPTIADTIYDINYWDNGTKIEEYDNVSGASETILGLTTLFYVLGVASAGIAVAAQGLRASGLV